MKLGSIATFLMIGVVIGILVPFFLSLCLFGTTFQTFMAGPQPTPGYWSGAPTAAPTAPPSQVQVWTNAALTSGGGVVFVLWSTLGAFVGEGIAYRRRDRQWHRTRNAWLGAISGSVMFIALTICGGLIR
jgi:hypothetical protein